MHTIGWNRSTVRHIPEEELHAYLDQALSRSQCVEIERHLARCGSCTRQRDNIAALRDRTTSLLARIGPPSVLPPAFAELQLRAAARVPQQAMPRRWTVPLTWAAGIAAAVLVGWQLNGRPGTEPPAVVTASAEMPPAEAPMAPAADQQELPVMPPVHVAVATPKPRRAAPPARSLVRATRPVGNEAPDASDFAIAYETDTAAFLQPITPRQTAVTAPSLTVEDMVPQPVSADPGLQGLWRTITPSDEETRNPADIALVPGLPVIQMRQQPGDANQGPVTAVDQLLESGEMIRTVSGSVSRVLAVADEDAAADSSRTTVSIRQGSRMVSVTGPTQALGSLLSRVEMKAAKRRY
jgi:hypothetical protein